MKKDLHPIYFTEAHAVCACGNKFTVGSTKEKIEVEICSACHPFYTGTEKVLDAAGRVEKFKSRRSKAEALPTKEKKAEKAKTKVKDEVKAKAETKTEERVGEKIEA